ncbi:MAG: hypothetical protein JSW11_15385 [Candidatus Heimdallarchaeota archaeon]|nr:MAG: hypothetical protein JSW11_15385 [Candidatus Heimdallarchaeota archaeon]
MPESSSTWSKKLFQKYKQLALSVRSDPLLSLVVFQFIVLGIIGLVGFVGWGLSLIFELSAPGYLNYITDHLEHWTIKSSWWGLLSLCVGFISFAAAFLIRKNDLLGAGVGFFALILGFITNMLVARNPPAHIAVGVIVGWIIVIPTIFYLIRQKSDI